MRPTLLPTTLACILVLSALGCSGNKAPEPIPSQTTTEVTPRLEPPPPLPPPVREIRAAPGGQVKVIDPGEGGDQPRTLLEASALAKKQKTTQRQAAVVITDDNLHEYTEGVQMMQMESEPAAPSYEEQAAAAAAQRPAAGNAGAERSRFADGGEDILSRPPPTTKDETYWRTRALELRMGWRKTQDDIEDLELEAAALRQEFYAQDDNYVRDAQIKPAWDRVLDRIHLLEERQERFEKELEVFVTEGQTTGVPQGWLNVGWELGPQQEDEPRPPAAVDDVGGFPVHQVEDPVVAPRRGGR